LRFALANRRDHKNLRSISTAMGQLALEQQSDSTCAVCGTCPSPRRSRVETVALDQDAGIAGEANPG
jgi:hypothetical protein